MTLFYCDQNRKYTLYNFYYAEEEGVLTKENIYIGQDMSEGIYGKCNINLE